jgi:ribonuclease BN (tRNA processing enzyme)
MKLTVIGCSDAFGTGGRLQTSFHVAHEGGEFLIDCGATTMAGLAREGIDPNRVGAIFISHLHGDHFGGLVWWLIHANHVGRRSAPLVVTGPKGIEARFIKAAEALFPNSTETARTFQLSFVEYVEGHSLEIAGVKVTPYEVSHPSGAPPYALRIEASGRTLAFSGDTEWVEKLVPAARGADLYISECYAFEQQARYHMNWRTIEEQLPKLQAKRILLTHLGPEMFANLGRVSHPAVAIAYDGLIVDL